jgi:hypothetical protein
LEDLLTYAAQSGFSVAVAAYLLVRLEGRMTELNGTLKNLEVILARMEERNRP